MARLFFFFAQLFSLLALTLATSSTSADLAEEQIRSIFSRGNNAKRDVLMKCQDPAFVELVQQAFRDAEAVLTNAVSELELLLSLFYKDGSGEMYPDKVGTGDRTFDEQNVFATYSFFIYRLYDPNRPQTHRDAYQAILHTKAIAMTMRNALGLYNNGQSNIGALNLRVHCNENEFFHERMQDGRNWTETNPTETNPDKKGMYYLAQDAAPHNPYRGNRQFTKVPQLCAEFKGQKKRPFGRLLVPVSDTWVAYALNAGLDSFDEVLNFCPWAHEQAKTIESTNLDNGLELRRLHVPRNQFPTAYQRAAMRQLVSRRLKLKWLGDWLVGTVIHELGHTKSFTPQGRDLVDIDCVLGGRKVQTAEDPNCLWAVAAGVDGLDADGWPQGHRDSEAFTIFVMALWANSATWWKGFEPRRRSNNPPAQGR